jgi:hypothetical protein
MSFFGDIFKVAAPIVGGFFGGPVGAAVGASIGGVVQQVSAQPALQRAQVAAFSPQVGFPDLSLNGGAPSVPIAGQVLPPGMLANITGPLAPRNGAACPTGFHLDKRTRSKCVRNRRMNPLNGRAASRAIRRIKGARKMLQKIERGLPRAKARATPRHGHKVHVHAD